MEYLKEPLELIKYKIDKLLFVAKISNEIITSEEIEVFYELELEYILNKTNQKYLPKSLLNTISNRILGKILKNKLSLEEFENLKDIKLENILTVTEIREYETSIKYEKDDVSTDKLNKLQLYIDYLCQYGEDTLYRFRRISWT